MAYLRKALAKVGIDIVLLDNMDCPRMQSAVELRNSSGRKGKPLLYADGQYAKLASLTHGEPLPVGRARLSAGVGVGLELVAVALPTGEIRWRNVFIRELGPAETDQLLRGKDKLIVYADLPMRKEFENKFEIAARDGPDEVQLGGALPQVKLAVSLNAPDDALRSRLMPVNRTHPLRELVAALRRFAVVTQGASIPERMHRVHTWMTRGAPFPMARTRWTLG